MAERIVMAMLLLAVSETMHPMMFMRLSPILLLKKEPQKSCTRQNHHYVLI